MLAMRRRSTLRELGHWWRRVTRPKLNELHARLLERFKRVVSRRISPKRSLLTVSRLHVLEITIERERYSNAASKLRRLPVHVKRRAAPSSRSSRSLAAEFR